MLVDMAYHVGARRRRAPTIEFAENIHIPLCRYGPAVPAGAIARFLRSLCVRKRYPVLPADPACIPAGGIAVDAGSPAADVADFLSGPRVQVLDRDAFPLQQRAFHRTAEAVIPDAARRRNHPVTGNQ